MAWAKEFCVPISTSGTYTQGDQIGSLYALPSSFLGTSGVTGVLRSISVADRSNTSPALDVHFFRQLVTLASTDNNPLSWGTTAHGLWSGTASVASLDYITIPSSAGISAKVYATVGDIWLPLVSAVAPNVYFVLKLASATAALGTGTDRLILNFGVEYAEGSGMTSAGPA